MEETDSNTSGFTPGEPGAELEAAALREEAEDQAVEQAAKAAPPVVVFKAATQDEGEIVRGLLESEGIPAVLVDQSSPPLGDALIAGDTHWGDILVAPADAERAKELIESSQNVAITDDIVFGSSAADVTDV